MAMLTPYSSVPEPVTFAELAPGQSDGSTRKLDVLADVPTTVSVHLGHTSLTVARLLSLAAGDVIELDRGPGSPVDVHVNGTMVGRAEVVVIEEQLGARLTVARREAP